MNIYKMNDFDYVAAKSAIQAREEYKKYWLECGNSLDDIDMQNMFQVEDTSKKIIYDEDSSKYYTFEEFLKLNNKPGFFCSTEYWGGIWI